MMEDRRRDGGTPSATLPRILFLDDDPGRALIFRAWYPHAEWVDTAARCIGRLSATWEEVHLDHDLGGQTHVEPDSPESGMAVIRWLGERPRPHLLTTQFVIHSHNPNAAWMMVLHLESFGFDVVVRPFGTAPPAGRRPGRFDWRRVVMHMNLRLRSPRRR